MKFIKLDFTLTVSFLITSKACRSIDFKMDKQSSQACSNLRELASTHAEMRAFSLNSALSVLFDFYYAYTMIIKYNNRQKGGQLKRKGPLYPIYALSS